LANLRFSSESATGLMFEPSAASVVPPFEVFAPPKTLPRDAADRSCGIAGSVNDEEPERPLACRVPW
jgi:hypothetical protein